jgi:hypothetical protein
MVALQPFYAGDLAAGGADAGLGFRNQFAGNRHVDALAWNPVVAVRRLRGDLISVDASRSLSDVEFNQWRLFRAAPQPVSASFFAHIIQI